MLFIAHFQVLISDNFGILALFQVLIAENVGILALFQAFIETILVFLTPLVTEKYVIDHKHVSDRKQNIFILPVGRNDFSNSALTLL